MMTLDQLSQYSNAWMALAAYSLSAGAPRRIWARQGPIFYPKFFDRLFLTKPIETLNLGKAQALGALPAMAPLVWNKHNN